MNISLKKLVPSVDLFRELNGVEQPARYVGGEFGAIRKDSDGLLRIALAFPDLYEIGMSNTAIKLLYGRLNQLEHVACERVFVPAPDFERALRERGASLYTLESGTPLHGCDVLAVSFSYELLATNLLTLLQSGGIPRRTADRTESDPLVVIGGPGATNPAPYGRFIDGCYIGEAEEGFLEIIKNLAALKLAGATRNEKLAEIRRHRSVWYSGKTAGTHRAIWRGFGSEGEGAWTKGIPRGFGAGFPVPSIPVVQDHGVVEIMRGCPQGCRFCHAGMFYRPYRMKEIPTIVKEADWLVHRCGYREISLSSLSSGDYGPLRTMMSVLNTRYAGLGVSLQLPSLRVDSFTLPILEQLNTVRRAGLTFAVESAGEEQQAWTNKLVPLSKVIAIAEEAKKRGWRRAKLYFMVGLPGPDQDHESERILDYVRKLRAAVPMEYILNVGTFVPKPHTPFQWEPQMQPQAAQDVFHSLRRFVPKGITLRVHNPWMSWLEGVLTRGDERVGEVIEKAFDAGARLDAWTDYLRIDIWKDAVAAVSGAEHGLSGRSLDDVLPWSSIHMGVAPSILRKERERAYQGETSDRCLPECEDRCGICNGSASVRHVEEPIVEEPITDTRDISDTGFIRSKKLDLPLAEKFGRNHQLFLEFKKAGSAAFLPHLAVVRVFERFWNRIGLPVELSEGHHPKPKMSFGQPLPIGIESSTELGVVNLQKTIHVESFSEKLFDTSLLPDGISILRVLTVQHTHGEKRIPAPMQLYFGSDFQISSEDSEFLTSCFLPACRESGGEILECQKEGSSYIVRLPRSAPGLGRLLKDTGGRGLIRALRLRMYTEAGGSLFDWYQEKSAHDSVFST